MEGTVHSVSLSYDYTFADPMRLAMVYGSKDPHLEAAVLATPRCWVSDDEEQEHRILAEIIKGTIAVDVAGEAPRYMLVFHWIASAIGASAEANADDDDANALEGDVIRSANPALERLGELPLSEVDSSDHPFLPAKGLAVQAADSIVCSVFSATDCQRTSTLLARRWADFTPEEIEVVGPLSRLLGRRRHHDVLLQLMF